jgi:hypothetical protein
MTSHLMQAMRAEGERITRLHAQKALKARLRVMMKENSVNALQALKWDYEAMDATNSWGDYCDLTGIGFELENYLDRREIHSPGYLARMRDVAEDMRGDY